jgi:hypothetical protein
MVAVEDYPRFHAVVRQNRKVANDLLKPDDMLIEWNESWGLGAVSYPYTKTPALILICEMLLLQLFHTEQYVTKLELLIYRWNRCFDLLFVSGHW